MVAIAFALFLFVHGLIHLMGFAKAFRYADLPALSVPIAPGLGLAWLLAAVLFGVAAVLVVAWPRAWWIVGGLAIAVSMVVIVSAWHDARFGAVANAIALVGVVFGWLAFGPASLRAAYDRDVAAATADLRPQPVITEADLAALPPAVQRYLRMSGAIGHPRVATFRVRLHGRIRGGPDSPWMSFRSEQVNVVGPRAARLFYLTATRAFIPIQGYHRFVGPAASMRIEAAALVPVQQAAGEEMTRSETVTLFNDMCVMAPATLLEPSVHWLAVARPAWLPDGRDHARARFTHLDRVIEADLVFDAASGALVDFLSDDRFATSEDGRRMTRQRWSTPLREYRPFGAARLASVGEARWHDGDRSWAYLELSIDDVEHGVGPGL